MVPPVPTRLSARARSVTSTAPSVARTWSRSAASSSGRGGSWRRNASPTRSAPSGSVMPAWKRRRANAATSMLPPPRSTTAPLSTGRPDTAPTSARRASSSPAQHGDGQAAAALRLGDEAVAVGCVADGRGRHHAHRTRTVAASDRGEGRKRVHGAVQRGPAEPPARVHVAHQAQGHACVGEDVEMALVGGAHHQEPRRVRADVGDGAGCGAHIGAEYRRGGRRQPMAACAGAQCAPWRSRGWIDPPPRRSRTAATRTAPAAALPQPRRGLAGLQPSRPGARLGRAGAGARAGQVPGDLRAQPRRVLPGARGGARPERRDRPQRPLPGRADPAGAA